MEPITRYKAVDGKEFETAEECLDYEATVVKKLARRTYWIINCGPDLTEGRGLAHVSYAYLDGIGYMDKEFMVDFMFRRYGRPVEWVMGASPIPNWTLEQIDADAFAHRARNHPTKVCALMVTNDHQQPVVLNVHIDRF